MGIAALELQNAETKRVAAASGSRRLTMGGAGVSRQALAPGFEGPQKLVPKKAYTTTQALSTLNHLLSAQYLRRGDGIASLPDSRRKERLFGEGRTSLKSAGSRAADRAWDYDPRDDTCIKAFVRLLAELVAQGEM